MAKFKPGQSGNPAGRKPGAKDKRTEMRELLRPHAANLVAIVLTKAMGGDMMAAKLLLDRICPPLRPQSERVNFATDGSLSERAAQLFEAATAGVLTPEQAADLAGLLGTQARIIETAELVKRIEAINKELAALRGGKS